MKKILLALLLISNQCLAQTFDQIKPELIIIARDTFGIPSIIAKTDAEVAYGLAWAHAEDDFQHIQHNLLAARGRLGEVLGKDGLLFDFALQFFGIDTFVKNRFEADISYDFKKVLNGYVQGLNAYAYEHPKEVLLPNALPFTEVDVISGYVLTLTLMSGAGMTLKSIKENRIEDFFAPNDQGSNAIAIAPSRTIDDKAWLLINSHQPIEGRFAWYETTVHSDEGWNITGGLFPGGTTIFVGSNQHLGWAHTNNFHNFGDVYQIKTKKGNKKKYLLDDEWHHFQFKTIRLKIKLGKLILPIKKKTPVSIHGPVFKTKHGWYALKFPSHNDLRSAEQWYRMNKSNNFEEFENAINMHALPMFNIIYADIDGNIFFQSGGKIPNRDTTLSWKQPLNGSNSRYLWKEILPISKMPSILNPECGYVFNANQTPLHASGESCNWKGNFIGMQLFDYNRGERISQLLSKKNDRFEWTDFLSIKFDKQYSTDGSYAKNFNSAFSLDEKKFPKLADAIQLLKKWDKNGTSSSNGASLAMVFHDILMKKSKGPFALLMIQKQSLSEKDAVWALSKSKRFLIKHYRRLDVPLGEIQRHIRGNINIPANGLREVCRAADSKLYDKRKGIYRITSGDGYIQMTKFGQNNIEIYAINAYGASAKPESSHYTDQMKMFQEEKFRKVYLDKDSILKKAVQIYHPINLKN
ncbi:MAG: penicillin acylase family protein [Candidatus Competibacteraceae bacterium]|nr:penicillin acylase family protein [Candidatus Competibacteraceae bacterium]